jgi:hypothetical protein
MKMPFATIATPSSTATPRLAEFNMVDPFIESFGIE